MVYIDLHLCVILEDLWEHLEKGSKKPVKSVMDTWTKQMGYPVLMVSSEKTANQTILKVAQKKFNADGSAGISTPNSRLRYHTHLHRHRKGE